MKDLILLPFRIHRIVFKLCTVDALLLLAVSVAVYIHVGWVYALYGICVGAVVSLVNILKDLSTWVEGVCKAQNNQADAVHFLGRCVRDKELGIRHSGNISNR